MRCSKGRRTSPWQTSPEISKPNGAKFQNKQKDASFSAIKVGGYAFFNDAVFEGPMDFIKADIASKFDANGAKFQNNDKRGTFDLMKVRGSALFYAAVFEGAVNFVGADFASDLHMNGAKFQNKEKG